MYDNGLQRLKGNIGVLKSFEVKYKMILNSSPLIEYI